MFGLFETTKSNTAPLVIRLARIEGKLDLILKQLGLEYQDGETDEIIRLLADGQKIAAIKLYRERTGAGLKEAKDAVEAIANGN